MTINVQNVSKAGYYSALYGIVSTGSQMKLGMNCTEPNYNYSGNVFINKRWGCKLSDDFTLGSADANGYPQTAGTGSTSDYFELLVFSQTVGVNRAGTFVIEYANVTSPAIVTVRNIGGGITYTTNQVSNTRLEVTITEEQAGNNLYVKFAGYSVNDIHMFYIDQETAYDAGNVLESQFKTDYENMAVLRAMDWLATNNSPYRNYSELPQEDSFVTVAGEHSVPISMICKACNELDCDLWFNVPNKMSDAGMASMAIDIDTYLDAGRKVYLEYSNECWNTATAFQDQNRWCQTYAETEQDGVLDNCVTYSYGVVTKSTHGLVDGDPIVFFNTFTNTDGDWGNGRKRYVIKIDNDNFAVSTKNTEVTIAKSGTDPLVCTVATVNSIYSDGDIVRLHGDSTMTEVNGNDYVIRNVGGVSLAYTFELYESDGVTPTDSSDFTDPTNDGFIMEFQVDASADTSITAVKYRPYNESYGLTEAGEGYATYALNAWNQMASGLSGRTVYKIGQAAVSGIAYVTGAFAHSSEYKESYDYMALGLYTKYTNFNSLPSTLTDSEIADEMSLVLEDRMEKLDLLLSTIGKQKVVLYEFGNDWTPPSSADYPEKAIMNTWARTAIAQDWYEDCYRQYATKGVVAACYFANYFNWDGLTSGSFGMVEYMGDTSSMYVPYKAMMDDGGASAQ